ncbi:MAG TPA: right-handed parallel beta-helix repeat-containing protein [Planctomycetota bacterium]|nr:right-handed parallel beta-helix repeat-containing protein [Planctomycetota bacterium]
MLAAVLAAGARADVLHVPAEFPTVQEAVDAAQPGDQIVLAAGSYHDPVEVQDAQDVTIRGQGQVILAGGSVAEAGLQLLNCTDVSVEHLRVEDALGTGIFVGQSTGVALRHVTCRAAVGEAVQVELADGMLLDHVLVEGPGSGGILLSECSDSVVSHCKVKGVDFEGIGLSDTIHCVVDHCRVTGANPGIALGLTGSSVGCQARKCVVLDAPEMGIRAVGEDCLLLDNRVQHAVDQGLVVDFPSVGGLVQGNKAIACGRGIEINGTGLLLRDNRIVSPEQDGLVCGNGVNEVADTRVLHAGHDAFVIGAVSGGSLTGCKASKATGQGFEVAGTHLVFTGNTSTGAGEFGFHVTGTDNLFVGNKATGSGAVGLDDEVGGNSYLENEFGVLN